MAAHRYWRATAFEAYGAGDLELSEFHLLAVGARVDATATLTASAAPDVSGVIANLQDDVLATAARWSAPLVKRLALTWDFGGLTADVDDIRLAGDSESRFPLIVKIEWSDDSISWVDLGVVSGAAWAGYMSKTTSLGSAGDATDPSFLDDSSLLHFSGADNSTTFIDETGKSWTSYGSPKIKTAQSKFGGSSIYFDQNSYIGCAPHPDFDLAAFDFTIECFVYQTSRTGGGAYFGGYHFTLIGNSQVGTGANAGFNLSLFGGIPFGGVYYNSSDYSIIGTSAIPLNTFVHIAYCRVGSTMSLYVDGVVAATGSFSSPVFSSTRPVTIGADSVGSARLSGYVDELRVTKGRSRYNGAFTPPVAPFGSSLQLAIARNRVQGRSAPSDSVSIGTGPIITYGTPKIALPDYLSIESGSVKDQITGLLGEGVGRVKGTVATKGSPNQPVHRKVRLIRERDGVVIREAWSNAVTGEYDFQYVDEAQTYTVVSYDHLHNYRAVIADNLVPELMP